MMRSKVGAVAPNRRSALSYPSPVQRLILVELEVAGFGGLEAATGRFLEFC
jgi:hypothetical protein